MPLAPSRLHVLWPLVAPWVGIAALAGWWGRTELALGLVLVVSAALVLAVLAAVHHAEVIALRLGEPFGTLVLALAVTVIETSLILTLMLAAGDEARTIARDTVYAAIMIICNGVVGLCLLLGALRHRVLDFRVDGTIPAFSVMTTLATFVLVLPNFTSTTAGPTLAPSQLAFAGMMSLCLYGVFVFVQTVRHREYFLPLVDETVAGAPVIPRPSPGQTWLSLALLLVALAAVVGLAKLLAPEIESAVRRASAPKAVVGIAIAALVLLPETWAAARAALRNRMQTSFNLALGSVLATIGLTIPAVAVLAITLSLPLDLGLAPKDITMLALTIVVTVMTLSRGRATLMQGAVHLVVFAAFLFLSFVP